MPHQDTTSHLPVPSTRGKVKTSSIFLQITISQYAQVFIAPLRKVTNTAAVDGLVRLCQSSQDRLFLQALGMTIGNKSWSDDFMDMQPKKKIKLMSCEKTKPLSSTMSVSVHHRLHSQPTSIEEVCTPHILFTLMSLLIAQT